MRVGAVCRIWVHGCAWVHYCHAVVMQVHAVEVLKTVPHGVESTTFLGGYIPLEIKCG